MLSAFIIVLREGFESFLLVAVILAYLRKSGQKWLTSSVFVAIVLALAASAGLAYVLNTGVDDATVQSMFGSFIGGYISQFFANEALREAVLGAIAVVMVGTLVIHMWRHGPKVQQRMRERLSAVSKSSRVTAVAGVFLFTFLIITREGMETALMLMQVKDPNLIGGALFGLLAAIAFAFGWAKFGRLINVRRFFQVTGIFLLLFMVQVSIYTFHEFSEAGLLPNSEFLHEATEKFSPDGIYGKWFSPIIIGICALWVLSARLIDNLRDRSEEESSASVARQVAWSEFVLGGSITLLLPWFLFYYFAQATNSDHPSLEIVMLLLYVLALAIGIADAQGFLSRRKKSDLERVKEHNKPFFDQVSKDISNILR